MDCQVCGTQLPQGAANCPRCGAATSYYSSTTGGAPDDPTVVSSSATVAQSSVLPNVYGSPPYQNPYEPSYVAPLAPPPPSPLRSRKRTGLIIVLAGLVILAAIGITLALFRHGDPIVGDWNVTYGAPAVVTISGSSGAYTVTAKSPVRVHGSSCDLPPDTIIATFSGSGNTYSGQHGLWYTTNCTFARWTTLSLTLNGNTLNGVLGDGETVTFTKIVH